MNDPIKGFSKLKVAKLEWLVNNNLFDQPDEARETFTTYWHADTALQQRHDEFIENTISNYYYTLWCSAKLYDRRGIVHHPHGY